MASISPSAPHTSWEQQQTGKAAGFPGLQSDTSDAFASLCAACWNHPQTTAARHENGGAGTRAIALDYLRGWEF